METELSCRHGSKTQGSKNHGPKKRKPLSDHQLLYLLIFFSVTFALVFLLDRFSDGEIPGVVHIESSSLVSGAESGNQKSELPPALGEPGDAWQNCGIYRQPVADEGALHTLAHGAVWITYHPILLTAGVDYLEGLLHEEKYVLLSPYPDQASPIVVTAWGVQLELSSVTDSRLTQFIGRYRLGPHAPESGASCVGGTGQPLR